MINTEIGLQQTSTGFESFTFSSSFSVKNQLEADKMAGIKGKSGLLRRGR
jgi:hypothetical protein